MLKHDVIHKIGSTQHLETPPGDRGTATRQHRPIHKIWWHSALRFSRHAGEQAGRQTNRQTDTLTTILHTIFASKVARNPNFIWEEAAHWATTFPLKLIALSRGEDLNLHPIGPTSFLGPIRPITPNVNGRYQLTDRQNEHGTRPARTGRFAAEQRGLKN